MVVITKQNGYHCLSPCQQVAEIGKLLKAYISYVVSEKGNNKVSWDTTPPSAVSFSNSDLIMLSVTIYVASFLYILVHFLNILVFTFFWEDSSCFISYVALCSYMIRVLLVQMNVLNKLSWLLACRRNTRHPSDTEKHTKHTQLHSNGLLLEDKE